MKFSALISLLALLGAVGCGSDPDSTGTGSGSFLPWKVGNTWTYNVTDSTGEVTEKVTTVGELEAVGGTGPHAALMANKVITEKADGADETHSWQAAIGDKVVRYREQAFDMAGGAVELEEHWDPYKLRIDGSAERTKVGDWLEEYTETKIDHGVQAPPQVKHDLWFVDQESERVTVPAGTFDAIVLRRVAGSNKTYWFARGVGKVKEAGGNQTEELTAYTVD